MSAPATLATPDSPTLGARLRHGLRSARLHARAFRRTRPFWGSVWLLLGGIWLIRFSNFSLGLALGSGWNSSAAYVVGGGMVMFALVGIFAPHYSALTGLVGVLLALAAFVSVNLGGFLIGSLLGILGGSMIWGWGEKRPRRGPATGA